MDFELKSLSHTAIPEALERAEQYRILGEPWQAESICLDVLEVDPANQAALVTLLLAITDQFVMDVPARRVQRAQELLSALNGDYERAYYAGIILERAARARLKHGLPSTNSKAYEDFREAIRWYEQAEAVRPTGQEESIWRRNTCVRTLLGNPALRPQPVERLEPVLLGD